MYNTQLEQITETLQNERLAEELGLEGYPTVSAFLSDFTTRLKKLSPIAKVKRVPEKTACPSKTASKLDSTDFEKLADLALYCPMGFKDHMRPYGEFLLKAITELRDVETRLYEPLTRWLMQLSSNKDYADVVWTDQKLTLRNSDALIAEFKSFFDPKIKRSDNLTVAKFSDLYGGGGDFKNTGVVVSSVQQAGLGIDVKAIDAAEDKLHKVLDTYIRQIQEDSNYVTANKGNIRRLSETVNAIVAETELLAVLMFNYDVYVTAYLDSAKKIEIVKV